MKKFFCAAIFCISLFAQAMDQRDDIKGSPYNRTRKDSSSELKIKVLQTSDPLTRRSSSPLTRSKRLEPHDNGSDVKPLPNGEPKQ